MDGGSETESFMKKKPLAEQPILPCPLCAGTPHDKGFGISCLGCGLWLGDGTHAARLGGYKVVWNRRVASKEREQSNPPND